MATKTLTVVRPGTYGTRMLKAGDPLEVNGRDARLYTALGWATDGTRPQVAAKPKAPAKKRAQAKKKAPARKK